VELSWIKVKINWKLKIFNPLMEGSTLKAIIITNNIYVEKKYKRRTQLIYRDCSIGDVFILARDQIYNGHKLLTHPLSGNFLLTRIPYKSVVLSSDQEDLCIDSLMMIESCIDRLKIDPNENKSIEWHEKSLKEYQKIDCELIDSALESQMFY
jgi:hypothetical protein